LQQSREPRRCAKSGHVIIALILFTRKRLEASRSLCYSSDIMFQKFVLKKLIGSKLKAAGMNDEQVDQLLDVVAKNPEFFKKIQDQIESKKKQGIPEQAAMMTVMRENQSELQKILGSSGIKK